jgi:hypothetical protein
MDLAGAARVPLALFEIVTARTAASASHNLSESRSHEKAEGVVAGVV